jgi:hypothetical protein
MINQSYDQFGEFANKTQVCTKQDPPDLTARVLWTGPKGAGWFKHAEINKKNCTCGEEGECLKLWNILEDMKFAFKVLIIYGVEQNLNLFVRTGTKQSRHSSCKSTIRLAFFTQETSRFLNDKLIDICNEQNTGN